MVCAPFLVSCGLIATSFPFFSCQAFSRRQEESAAESRDEMAAAVADAKRAAEAETAEEIRSLAARELSEALAEQEEESRRTVETAIRQKDREMAKALKVICVGEKIAGVVVCGVFSPSPGARCIKAAPPLQPSARKVSDVSVHGVRTFVAPQVPS